MLSYTDIFNRNPELLLYGYCNTSLGCTVKLGDDDTCYIGHFTELLGLSQSILSGGPVQNYQGLPVAVRVLTVNYPVYLL